MTKIAIATVAAAIPLDEDLEPLKAAFTAIGVEHTVLCWDDPKAPWSDFDAVIIRSTWDYTERLPEFLAWCERVDQVSKLLNPLSIIRWNTDKRYLADLQRDGIDIIESVFLAPGDDPQSIPEHDEFVVKPTVGAGSKGCRRFTADQRPEAIAHARALLQSGYHVMVQPYLHEVDELGETALIFFDGLFSHAIRKGPLLTRNAEATSHLFAPEKIIPRTPSEAELILAMRVLENIPGPSLAYVRVDLLPSAQGPKLLELELTEPSLFFDHSPDSALRFAKTLSRRCQ